MTSSFHLKLQFPRPCGQREVRTHCIRRLSCRPRFMTVEHEAQRGDSAGAMEPAGNRTRLEACVRVPAQPLAQCLAHSRGSVTAVEPRGLCCPTTPNISLWATRRAAASIGRMKSHPWRRAHCSPGPPCPLSSQLASPLKPRVSSTLLHLSHKVA